LDETLSLPTEEAATIALRTQQIIADESGVVNTADPLGGSYFVEALTNRMEQQAFEYINKIDEMGGIIAAIENGFPQREIADAAYHYQRQLERNEKVMVGVNKYVMEEESEIDTLVIDESVEREQKERLSELLKRRDDSKVKEELTKLKKAAEGTENVMPHILESVRAYATLQEITDTLKEVFGEYTDPGYL
jgi:methylmalonyl-CoA mutase N-terminal domain/subunit